MCGRVVRVSPNKKIVQLLGLPTDVEYGETVRCYNIAPGAGLWNVQRRLGSISFESYYWGFAPAWARPGMHRSINARAETLTTGRYFRQAFHLRRSLIFIDGFYEWRKADRQPFFIHRADGEPFALAGLYEQQADAHLCCVIITTSANALIAPLHDRMPVIVPAAAYHEWIDPDNQRAEELQRLLVPSSAEELEAYPVSREANSPKNDSARLIERMAL